MPHPSMLSSHYHPGISCHWNVYLSFNPLKLITPEKPPVLIIPGVETWPLAIIEWPVELSKVEQGEKNYWEEANWKGYIL